ncbi:hypothetical protein [Hymenobacter metallicola]|uniref:Uncharacterized protein n=1 Tax=Hymenobacter metallicola TaxID=2563114 RepID=A0A4Z0Q332_9BACT|nr:hypothetical protein [Hymenobacter metallicola]TGE23543.1 hypothetical protein E5K02_20370 [Hymenobacter metallicola]
MNTTKTLTRQTNKNKRNERIRAAFQRRYTEAPRPRKFSREYIIAELADEFFLATSTLENILYQQTA